MKEEQSEINENTLREEFISTSVCCSMEKITEPGPSTVGIPHKPCSAASKRM